MIKNKKDLLKLLIKSNLIARINNILSISLTKNNISNIKLHPNNIINNNLLSSSNTKLSLERFNKNNSYINQMYNYNNNNNINNRLKDILVKEILNNYFSSMLKLNIKTYRKIKFLISKPIFKHTNDKLNIILFIYNKDQLMGNYHNHGTSVNNNTNEIINYNTLLYRMINNINLANPINNSLNNILSKLYNKPVIIEPIILKNDYLNSYILSNNISDNIKKYKNLKGPYIKLIEKNITLINPINISYNIYFTKKYINNIINNNILLNYSYIWGKTKNQINNIINQAKSINNLSLNYSYNDYLTKNNIIWNLLNNKYIIGYGIKLNGKLPLAGGNKRSEHYSMRHGTFKHKLSSHLSTNFILNSHKSNITFNNYNNINKNGKYNINIKLGHI